MPIDLDQLLSAWTEHNQDLAMSRTSSVFEEGRQQGIRDTCKAVRDFVGPNLMLWQISSDKNRPLVCECGAAAAGTTHSEWCPKVVTNDN